MYIVCYRIFVDQWPMNYIIVIVITILFIDLICWAWMRNSFQDCLCLGSWFMVKVTSRVGSILCLTPLQCMMFQSSWFESFAHSSSFKPVAVNIENCTHTQTEFEAVFCNKAPHSMKTRYGNLYALWKPLRHEEEVWHDYGLVLWHVGRHMEAAHNFQNAIITNPTFPKGWSSWNILGWNFWHENFEKVIFKLWRFSKLWFCNGKEEVAKETKWSNNHYTKPTKFGWYLVDLVQKWHQSQNFKVWNPTIASKPLIKTLART